MPKVKGNKEVLHLKRLKKNQRLSKKNLYNKSLNQLNINQKSNNQQKNRKSKLLNHKEFNPSQQAKENKLGNLYLG